MTWDDWTALRFERLWKVDGFFGKNLAVRMGCGEAVVNAQRNLIQDKARQAQQSRNEADEGGAGSMPGLD